MLKRLTVFLVFSLLCADAFAQNCGKERYEISASGVFGYNATDAGYGVNLVLCGHDHTEEHSAI